MKGRCYGCSRDHQKGEDRAKASACHMFGKYGHFAKVCLSTSSDTSSRSSQGKQSHDTQQSTITTSINITITKSPTGPIQNITANATVVRRHMKYRSPVVLRVTSVINVLCDYPVTAKMRGTMGEQLIFALELTQVNQITHGSKVYVNL